jgi:hypothetical protein
MPGIPTSFLQGVLGQPSYTVPYEPQRTNGALLYINLDNDTAGYDAETLTLSLKTFSLPKVDVAPSQVGFLNEKRKFAGEVTFDDINVTFNDYVDRGTLTSLLNWFYQVYDPRTGKKGLKVDYAKTGFITMFAPNGDYNRQWNLMGVWPRNVDPGEADQGADDLIQVSMSLSIDKAIPAEGFDLNAPM